MMLEKVPHHFGGIDIPVGVPDNDFGQGSSAWPGMPASFDGVENNVTVGSTVCELDPTHIASGR
jgi:hypothetical protein